MYLLLPIGLISAGRQLRMLAISSLPVVAVLLYIQQPERALWNFHFVAIPLAVLVLQQLPDWACWLFIVCFGISNLRFGAQLTMIPLGHVPLVISLIVAGVAVWHRLTSVPRAPRMAQGVA